MRESLESFHTFVGSITRKTLLLGGLGATVLAVCSSHPAHLNGFVVGVVFGVLKFRFSARQMLKWAASGAAGVSIRSYGLRYALTGVFLLLAFAIHHIDPLAAIVGLFLPNAVIVGDQLLSVGDRGVRSEGDAS